MPGLLTISLIPVFVTGALILLAYTLGNDDLDTLKEMNASNEECQMSEE